MTVARKPPTVWFTVRGFPIHIPRKPRRFFEEMSGGEALFPLIVLVGMNAASWLDQTRVRCPRPQHRTVVPPLQPGVPHARRAHPAGWPVARSAAGVLLRPARARCDRGGRCGGVGRVRCVHRSVGHGADAGDRAIGRGDGARGDHAVAQLVARPTTTRPKSAPDVFGFHAIGMAIGSFIGPALGGLMAYYWGWRAPFFVFAIPTLVFVILGLRLHEPGRGHWERAAAGANARSDRDRRDTAVVRGVDPHPVADRNPAPHLVLAPLPRGLVPRPHHAHVAVLRAGVPSRRLPTRRGGRVHGARAGCGHPARHSARGAAHVA